MKQPKVACLVAILAALVALRVFFAATTPLFDPSEGRYGAICANMAATSDFLVPHFIHDGVYQSFDGKPPLLFQLGGLCCKWLGREELAVRIPSMLAALILGLTVFGVTRKLLQLEKQETAGERSLMAVLVCLTSVAFYATAGFCMTDMLLAMCVSGAILLEHLFNQSPRKLYSLGVFGLLGVGMLVKGPVALVLFGLPTFVDCLMNHRWKVLGQHAWAGGLLLFLAIAAPWYVLMQQANPGFLKYFFINENLLRFLVHDYGDKYGAGRETFRGMALVWALVVTLPWTPLALWQWWQRGHKLALPGNLLGWAMLLITAFWCLTSRVPLAYLLPIVPLFAVWLAMNSTPALVRHLVPVAGVIAVVALGGTMYFTANFSSKAPGRFFETLLAQHPDEAFAFVRHQPYSAEFYFGGRLHLVPQPGDILIQKHGSKWELQ